MLTAINPLHYSCHTIQPIDVIEDWQLSYHLGNVIKYLARYQYKDGLIDLRKAEWYLSRYIDLLSNTQPTQKEDPQCQS